MAKILTSIVAENLSQMVEQHQLLPKTHFSERQGRSTTATIHRITTAWRENKVVSVLLLDVEGTFPNAVPAKLIHNLKKRHTPTSIINFIKQLLNNRKTRLKFDDYTSVTITVTNGIGQGDLLSMILYILYNANILEIPNNPQKEDEIGYIDNIALLVIVVNLIKATKIIKNMMTRDKGSQDWSLTHNSTVEVIKSTISHFSRKTEQRPQLRKWMHTNNEATTNTGKSNGSGSKLL